MADVGQSASSSSNEDDDSTQNIYCTLCKIGFSGIVPYNLHVNGSKHKKAETKAYMKNKYNIKYKEAVEKLKSKDVKSADTQFDDASEVADDEGTVFTCEVCKKVCTGYTPFQNHLAGSSHAKQIRKMKVIESLKKQNQFPNEIDKKEDNTVFTVLPQLKPFATCDICNKEFSGPEQYHNHRISGTHQKALQNKALVDDLIRKGVEINQKIEEEEDTQRFFIFCNDCKKGFSGPIPYHQHMMSKTHVAQKKKADLMNRLMLKFPEMLKDGISNEKTSNLSDSDTEDILICTVCHMSFSGPESARDHFLSKRHEKAKREKSKLEKFKKKRALSDNNSTMTESPENDYDLANDQHEKPKSSTAAEDSKLSHHSPDDLFVKSNLNAVAKNSKKGQKFRNQTVNPEVSFGNYAEKDELKQPDSISNEFVMI